MKGGTGNEEVNFTCYHQELFHRPLKWQFLEANILSAVAMHFVSDYVKHWDRRWRKDIRKNKVLYFYNISI